MILHEPSSVFTSMATSRPLRGHLYSSLGDGSCRPLITWLGLKLGLRIGFGFGFGFGFGLGLGLGLGPVDHHALRRRAQTEGGSLVRMRCLGLG